MVEADRLVKELAQELYTQEATVIPWNIVDLDTYDSYMLRAKRLIDLVESIKNEA